MRNRLFWTIFLSVLMMCLLGYTIRTAIHIYGSIRLDKEAEGQQVQWSVVSLSGEAFMPFARYQFTVDEKVYQGETQLQETYLNPWTAQEAIKRMSGNPIPVWYDSSYPEISSLQKHFPLKETLYTLLLWILGVYFIGLGYYVKRHF